MQYLRTVALAVLSIFLIIVLSIAYTTVINLGKQGSLYSDYGKFYQSAQFVLAGKNMYTPVFFTQNIVKKVGKTTVHKVSKPYRLPGNLNLPIFTLLILPLAYLSYGVSMWVWSLVSIVCGIGTIFLLRKQIFAESNSIKTLGLVIGFFAYYPTLATLHFGQITLFLLPLVVGAWLASRNNQALLAAILLGIATGIKPFFGLFLIYFLVRREWQATFIFTLTILISLLIPLLIFGKQTFFSYQETLNVINWTSSSWNISIWGMLGRFFGSNKEMNAALIPIVGLNSKVYLILAGLLLLTLIKFLRSNLDVNNTQKADINFSITLIIMLLVAPLGWIYYFPFLIVPLTVLWQFAQQKCYPIMLPLAIAIIIFLTGLPEGMIASGHITQANALSVFLWSSIYTITLIMLLVIFFRLSTHCVTQNNASFTITFSKNILFIIFITALLPSLIGAVKSVHTIALHHNGLKYYQIAYYGN